jgi:hypothetical protein
VLTVVPASAQVAGIIFVGGKIVIGASFNTRGRVLVTSQVTNTSSLIAAVASKGKRCRAGQALLEIGNTKRCVSNSFGTSTKIIPAPGSYVIRLSPNGTALKALNRGRTLHVKVTLMFKPSGGGRPVVRTLSITVRGKKKGK